MENITEWKRPSDIMKIHRRRKSVSQKRITAPAENRTTVIYKSPSKSVKRRNPFSVSETASENPAKRQNVGSESRENECDLFEVLSRSEKKETKEHMPQGICNEEHLQTLQTDLNSSPVNIQKEEQKSSLEIDNKQRETGSPFERQVDVKPKPYVPVDWSLKTKMRIVSSQSLQWCTQLKSTDEANGLSKYVTSQQIKVDSLTDQKKRFQACCLYWEHPNIPWVRLFPRIIDDSKLSTSGSYLLQDDVQKTLQADWEQSFTSAYHQLRSRLCPYFYLCTHLFTVMFYNQSAPHTDMVAMVTPTTRGFREALENEGITFKLPVCNKMTSPGKSETNSKENKEPVNMDTNDVKRGTEHDDDDDAELLETDDAASGWLESIGLDKKSFPSLDPRKVKLQREGFRVIDNRPESLVFIQGGDVQALFNFLLNCRTCTANSGPQAGVPPTVLSPSPFKGATLKSHKVKHSTVKQCDREGHINHAYILEVTGPILTSHSQAVTALLHQTQSADFSLVYNNHDATTPFNILPKTLQKQYCLQCGSSSCHRDGSCDSLIGQSDTNSDTLWMGRFYKHVDMSDRLSAIKEVKSMQDGFTWVT